MKHRGFVRLLRAVLGLLTLAALLRQLTVHWAQGALLANFFSYYTILSNLFAGCVLLLSAADTKSSRHQETLRFISVVNMVLVGIVFVTLLRNTDLGDLLPWVNFVHHYLMPCVVLADWLVIPPGRRLDSRELLISLSFPLIYLAYSLIRGAMVGWYPYPFLNAGVVGGAAIVAVYVVGITIVFCLVGSVLLLIGNRRSRHHGPA